MSKIFPSCVNAPGQRRSFDSGQVTMFLALMMGIFLVAFVGFATDYTTYWFQRQAIQSATDATCQAAAMDLYRYAGPDPSPGMNFVPSAGGVSCTASPTAAPCRIAAYNGYNASMFGVTVAMSFPTTEPGVTPGPGVAWPFVKVDITKQAPTYFSGLLTRLSTVNVHATATCGLVSAVGGGDVIVLDPYPQITSVSLTGNANLNVVGGSTVGIQVNADSIRAVSYSGSHALIDMSKGGLDYGGSDLGVTGIESDPGSGHYNGGSEGVWLSPHSAALNPYAGLNPPASVYNVLPMHVPIQVGHTVDGCPDQGGCWEYWPGYYSTSIPPNNTTAIFNAGIYYMDGNVGGAGHTTLRMAKPATAQQTDGVMFYFHTGTFSCTGNCGSSNSTLDPVPSTALTCDGSAPPASLAIPATVTGNVLTAQCTTKGTYYDGGGDTTDSLGTIRGLLFFSDINNSSSPDLGGNAVTVFTGSEYFHDSTYTVTMNAHGNGGGTAYTWGNIVVDNISVVGNGQFNFLLGGANTSPVVRVAMVQ